MKFRVVRNEALEKAMNKANLVLVEVPVNTKKGQHRSHRWKRAIDALDQLFQDLGKKANAKDITFVDKKTNKKVNKDELIEDYEKKGKQENKTLQAFVAENYKVSTEKEEKSTNNKQSIKENPENQVLYEETPKNEVETMYSTNKYKREKFTGTFSCGHEGEVYAGGYSDEYRQQSADEQFHNRLCPHCFQKKIEEEREKAKKEAEILKLPELTGSVKQVNWAISIRSNFINDMKPFIEFANKNDNEFNRLFVKIANHIQNITDSEYWIDHRDEDFAKVITNNIAMFKFDIPPVRKFTGEWATNKISVLDPEKDLMPLNDDKATERRIKLCKGINQTGTDYLESLINDNNPKYKDSESKTSFFLDEFNTAIDLVKNNNDVFLWRNFRTTTFGIQDYLKYSPKINYSEEDLKNPAMAEKLDQAYSRRIKLIREFRQGRRKGLLSETQVKVLDAFFQSATEETIYNETYKDLSVSEIADSILKQLTEKNPETKTQKQKSSWTARLRYGTKRIESKKEYAKAENFEDFSNKLEKLKDLHTDIVGRAALDMAGIDVPLYVKRNGGSIKTGKTNCLGYCSRGAFGTPVEVAIVDNPNDKAHSYKTTVHETMHALFGTTTGDSNRPFIWGLQHGFEEGLVEIAACASLKKAYGKEYMEKDRRSYEGYVAQTLLRLKKTKRFRGKTLSEIGKVVSEAAFERDGKTLNSIKDSLNRSVKNHRDFYEFAKEYDDINRLENATKRKYSAGNNGDMTNFEKTELAMFIDRLKNTDLTLKEALETKGDTAYLALVLLYNILDEEDDELLGLL